MFLLRLVLAGGIAFFFTQIKLDYLESLLYDVRVRVKPVSPISDNIRLVLNTQESVQKLKGVFHAQDLVKALDQLESQSPKVILLNINPEFISGTLADKKVLAQFIEQKPNVYVVYPGLILKGEEEKSKLPAPFENVRLVSGPKTTDLKILAKDNVTRRMLISYQEQPLMPVEIGSLYNSEVKDLSRIVGQFEFAGSDQIYIDFRPTRTFPFVSLAQLLIDPKTINFSDKIVIIGNDTEQNSDDYILTPFSREVAAMSLTEMHANMIETVIGNSAVRVAPAWLNLLFVFLIAAFTIHIVLTMKPAKGLLVLASSVVGFVVVSFLAFWPFKFWIVMAHPLLAIFLCYYFFIPYRLIVENRRSWEYYQKNKLLSQVEELKTNFISMMSHDLKTPIARIQGMTDVISADSTPISSQQREAVDTIKHSADDLLKFINAILNYGRIESEGVRLNLQSKDLNNILTEVIRKHEFLAKIKRIQIVSELEPLFPIPVDADLMKQVLSNLVENAIKYSPEDTKILVSSEERDNYVVIQVADQGQGIPQDELQNIFMKFFRSKNAKSSPIKGSGLGLYLAKYFTELHQGRIYAESEIGEGSTFTVELPTEQSGNPAGNA
jgi:Osmosensitive K+ channel histidine kinase